MPTPVALLCILATFTGYAQTSDELDRRVIAAAKKVDVNTLEKQLPHAPFDEWLQKQVGATARIEWESNDCGEQDGVNRAEDFPLCGEATVKLPAGGKLGVQLAVGSLRKGVHGKPAVWFLYFQDKNGHSGDPRRLSDLSKLLEKLR